MQNICTDHAILLVHTHERALSLNNLFLRNYYHPQLILPNDDWIEVGPVGNKSNYTSAENSAHLFTKTLQ